MKKIDAFAHILPRTYFERVDEILADGGASPRVKGYRVWFREDPALVDLDARWRSLEPFDDYLQILVLAVPPIEELGPPKVTRELARLANDELARLVSTHPDRFLGFVASLPLNDVEASLEEIERAVDDLGALGVQLHSNVAGAPLDGNQFEPLFARMAELDRMIWLHPTRSPIWTDYPTEPESKFDLWWCLGWPYETSVAMARLVYSGHLERYPSLRIITHHSGAMIPPFSGRLAVLPVGNRDEVDRNLTKEPLEYFKMFYADTAMFGAPHAVRCAMEFFGPDHVLFGTDWPLGGPGVIRDTIADIASLDLEPEDVAKVFHRNAEQLLRIPA